MSFPDWSVEFENSDSDEDLKDEKFAAKKASTRQSKFSQISFPDRCASDISINGDYLSPTQKYKGLENKFLAMEPVCDIHEGQFYESGVIPPPCIECKAIDGHGQKARVIMMSDETVDSDCDKKDEKQNGILASLVKRFRRLLS